MSKKLRAEDVNKANPNQITVQYQTHINDADNAPNKFFGKVDVSLFGKPSYKQFIDMMDNFYKEAGKAEPRVSKEEEQREIATFLGTVVRSGPFNVLFKFLNAKITANVPICM
ncbi:endoribonuclease XendoU [Oesophagostomum dentatum]|uniref:Endoribonuclease XendoU n=1 Tax=Oesophagostomum dentatum TaxID=61180 RepID=A0A0B1TNI3_OESDE|nr:endoribonuclease XendoU [Oesophagostomum dentatum]